MVTPPRRENQGTSFRPLAHTPPWYPMKPTPAFAAFSAETPLRSHEIARRDPMETDVEIDILFCGVCHSDLHTVRSEWAGTKFPCVPGHEIVGRITGVGSAVTQFRPGMLAGVGCMVDSCGTCPDCTAGLEQFCSVGTTFTYNSPDQHTGGVTYGGYAGTIVVDQRFVLRIPDSLEPAGAAPLLCAGITTYSPLRHWNVGPGKRCGVVGLGGLGHMAVKIAHAMGAHVTLFTTSASKISDGHRLGADDVVVTRDEAALTEWTRTAAPLDMILDTVAASHNLDTYLAVLARDGTMVVVGAPPTPHPAITTGKLINKRRSLAGSLIGGIAETQEMLDFCAKHDITADIELIRIQQINEAYERMLRSDVKYRFVIDIGSLRA